ncbi:glycosyltransferase [Terrihabitans sp. B22-R8]|uniref:glycosyltransferase n=1 Tax=Terrihabitans sp. B22-R8 TaxID=3425128 RepID=UPI00403CDBED
MRTSDIAVLMPAYNPEPKLLAEAVDALLAQSRPVDIIVVDDGSQVAVRTLLAEHERLTVLRLPQNVGVTRARNAGLKFILDQGYSYIACNDCDDISLPDRFELQMARFETDGRLDLLGGMSPTYDDTGKFLFTRGTTGGPDCIRKRVRYNLPFAHSTFCFRASVVRTFGDYSVDYPAGEDYEFLYRIIARGGQVDCLEAPLATYLLNPGGITYNNWRAQISTRLKTQLHYFEPRAFESYVGVARSLLTLVVPQGLWRPLKVVVRTIGQRLPG